MPTLRLGYTVFFVFVFINLTIACWNAYHCPSPPPPPPNMTSLINHHHHHHHVRLNYI